MKKFIKNLFTSSAILLFACGVGLIAFSLLPYAQIKSLIDSLAPDGNYQGFSINYVNKIRSGALFICTASGLFYVARNIFLQYLFDILALISCFVKDLREAAKKEDKIHSYTFVLIILLAIIVRIYYLFQPMMGDESRIFDIRIYHAHGIKGFIYVLSTLEQGGDHLFNTALSFLTYKLSGCEDCLWTSRLPALFAGILIVPASYMMIRALHNKNAALLASGIIAASSPLISYSANSRGYTMIILIFMLILALGAYVKNSNNVAGWHLFAILSAVGWYAIRSMIYSYGIAITWLFLSILFKKDSNHKRSRLLLNLLVSIAITGFLTFLLYSPVVFFGKGSLVGSHGLHQLFKETQTWADIERIFYNTFWFDWNRGLPVIITYLLIVGVIIAIVFHKKLCIHRVPVALAVAIWTILISLITGSVCHYTRCWLPLLPLYIGLASSGIIYLSKPIEIFFYKYKTAVYAFLAVALSIILTWNQIRSNPYQIGDYNSFNDSYSDNIDSSGYYIEFKYIINFLLVHINLFNENEKLLILLSSPSENDFWKTRIKYYHENWAKNHLIYDLNYYLFRESQKSHNLFLLSNKPLSALEDLLEKNAISVSDYSAPQLIHHYKHANLYKMSRINYPVLM